MLVFIFWNLVIKIIEKYIKLQAKAILLERLIQKTYDSALVDGSHKLHLKKSFYVYMISVENDNIKLCICNECTRTQPNMCYELCGESSGLFFTNMV